jgi:hypothetical protein
MKRLNPGTLQNPLPLVHTSRWAVLTLLAGIAFAGTLSAQTAATPTPTLRPFKVHLPVHALSRSPAFKYAPKLPSVEGCYTLSKANAWTKGTCLDPEFVRTHYPHPELEPGVQFNAAPSAGTISPMPVTGGAIDVGLTSMASEDDPTWGKGYFSVQLNTNAFNDASNHLAAVQFVDMHSQPTATTSSDLVCIWNVDITAQTYPNTCHTVITGRAARSQDFVAVQAYQDFQSTGYLKMVFQLSWDSQSGTYGVVSPDLNGLTKTVNKHGNWNELTGSILGYGNGSKANFTKTQLWIAIDTWNCQYDANDDCIGYDPGPWTWTATKPVTALWGLTEEQNNLSPDDTYTSSTPASSLPKLLCPGWNGCYIEYSETAP